MTLTKNEPSHSHNKHVVALAGIINFVINLMRPTTKMVVTKTSCNMRSVLFIIRVLIWSHTYTARPRTHYVTVAKKGLQVRHYSLSWSQFPCCLQIRSTIPSIEEWPALLQQMMWSLCTNHFLPSQRLHQTGAPPS